MDMNELRRRLAGLSEQEIYALMAQAGGADDRLPMNSMRNEETGNVTYFRPQGMPAASPDDMGFSRDPYPIRERLPPQDWQSRERAAMTPQQPPPGGPGGPMGAQNPQAGPSPFQQPQAPQKPRIRVFGVGNGQTTDLGEEDQVALPVDYTRAQVVVPGIGKGHYTADGRYVVGSGPDGSQWKVIIGYDAARSDARNRALKEDLRTQQAHDVGIAKERQQIEQSKESVLTSQAARTQKEGIPGAGIPQKRLEEQYGKPPEGSGQRWRADGTLEDIPGAGGGKMTESQAKALGFGMRAATASEVLDLVGKGGAIQPGLIKRAAESVPFIGGGLGLVANLTQSTEQQQVEQAQRDFINAILRRESGAVISPDEFANARLQYFPQPGDMPEVIKQKKVNRELQIRSFREEVGRRANMIDDAAVQQRNRYSQQMPKPNASAVSAAKNNPRLRQEFIDTFGPEAAARYGI